MLHFLAALTLGTLIYVKTTAARSTYENLHQLMLDGRIVGGNDTTIEEHPYQLSLQRSGAHFCGASLIKPNAALTAAHCTAGREAKAFTIRAGSTVRGTGGVVVKIKSICQHPKYTHLDYDISVLLLDQPFTLSSIIKTIPLQPKSRDISTGSMGTVTGWGTLTQGGSVPSTLQVVAVPKINQEECSKAYPREEITDRMVCFGYTHGGKDSCQGDSGGPLVVKGNQVGVVSWGYGCAQPKRPDVYTKVANEEINEHINQCIADL